MAAASSLAQTILYVASPKATAALFETALGLTTGFLQGDVYASMKGGKEGEQGLAFASHSWANGTHGEGKLAFSSAKGKPHGSEVCFGTPDVDASFARAVKAGFAPFKQPYNTPWGSRMAYLREPLDGHIISFSGKATETEAPAAGKPAAAAKEKGKAKAATKAAPAAKKGVKASADAPKAAKAPTKGKSNTAKVAARAAASKAKGKKSAAAKK